MIKRLSPTVVKIAAIFAFAATANAHSYGPPPRVTGAPGDSPQACTLCHSGTLNPSSGGKVEILLPNGPTYFPGVTQHLMVHVADPAQKRWGFELSARLNSNPASGQAGDLATTDDTTQVICNDGSPKPCASPETVQFIEHSLSGTRNGTPNGATFEFDWTPPAADSGPITLYVAGNAANGNGSSTGDHIYTSSIELSPGVAVAPTIVQNGVANAASFQTTIAPDTWVTIFGSNLAVNTRVWAGRDIHGGTLPATLDGTSVTINGKPAYVAFISPGQVNVLAPDDSSSGPVQVEVTTPGGKSAVVTQLQPVSPAFFLFDGKYLAAGNADGTALGKAKPGQMAVLFGTGFGPASPVASASQVVSQPASLAGPLQLTIGGVAAKVLFAGLAPGFAGLYQFNVLVPETLPDGDQKVIAQIGGVSTPASAACCFIAVQH